MAKKRAAEARLAAQEAGISLDDDVNENIFELQHHHLLRCLEKTTVGGRGQESSKHALDKYGLGCGECPSPAE